MCMTPGCGSVQNSKVQAYTPKGVNAPNPFTAKQNKGVGKTNHASASAMFYGNPAVKASFKIGKY